MKSERKQRLEAAGFTVGSADEFLDLTPEERAWVSLRLADSKAENFDGHTEFEKLSPQARLQWLDAAVSFWDLARRAREARKERK